MKHMKYILTLMLILFSSIATADDTFSLEVNTAHTTITATDCSDIVGLFWIEYPDRHSGKMSARNCNNISESYAKNTSPVTGQHAMTVDVFNTVDDLLFECAMVEYYKDFSGVTRVVVFCKDQSNWWRRR